MCFPGQWKIANIKFIKNKTKDKTKLGSYRPIALLSTLEKIYERVIVNRIYVAAGCKVCCSRIRK